MKKTGHLTKRKVNERTDNIIEGELSREKGI